MVEYQWVKFWFSYIKVSIRIIPWDWIHINETSIEFGSQSRSWINIKTKTKQKNTQTNKEKTKQNVNKKNDYAHYDFPGYSKCGKNILWLFSCDIFSNDATHTCKVLTFLSKTSAYLACIHDMYNERRTQGLHRHPVLCIWSRSTLLSLNKIPCLLYEQLFIYTTIWFKRNILLGSILSLSYYLLC